jgi:hypothetical protein
MQLAARVVWLVAIQSDVMLSITDITGSTRNPTMEKVKFLFGQAIKIKLHLLEKQFSETSISFLCCFIF